MEYPSWTSKYYPMFCRLGFPQLDIVRYEDGEWSIIEYLKAPLIEAMTPWHHVLRGLRNVEITEGFVSRFVRQCDLHRREFWDREEAKSRAIEEQEKDREKHREAMADAALQAVKSNEGLMERIAKNGIHEMDIGNIYRNIAKENPKAARSINCTL